MGVGALLILLGEGGGRGVRTKKGWKAGVVCVCGCVTRSGGRGDRVSDMGEKGRGHDRVLGLEQNTRLFVSSRIIWIL